MPTSKPLKKLQKSAQSLTPNPSSIPQNSSKSPKNPPSALQNPTPASSAKSHSSHFANFLAPDIIATYYNFAKHRLGIEFNDIDLLITALTHRSYVNEHKKIAKEHNERLEFLGDAILELVVSDYLFRQYDFQEGIMTAIRAALVRTESISLAGTEMGYEPLVRMSRGEKNGSERAHAVILADCFEAVIGAVYLDQGYQSASDLIHRFILSKTAQIVEEGSWRDPKSRLQELAQHRFAKTPTYRTLNESGPDHDKTFTVGAYIGKTCYATATGHSKQEAQTAAALAAVKSLLHSSN